MSYKPRYDKTDWKSICDICGRIFKASSLRQRWDGFMACPDDWEPRQMQDYVRGVADTQAPKWTRPEATDTYVLGCTTRTSIAGWASAGCMVAGSNVNPGIVLNGTFTPPGSIYTSLDNAAIADYAIANIL